MSNRVLKRGKKGSDVAELQAFLGISPTDGIFCPITETAVIEFQTKSQIEADGIVGPQTYPAIDESRDCLDLHKSWLICHRFLSSPGLFCGNGHEYFETGRYPGYSIPQYCWLPGFHCEFFDLFTKTYCHSSLVVCRSLGLRYDHRQGLGIPTLSLLAREFAPVAA